MFGSASWVHHLIGTYGLWVLFVMVFLESSGLPMPGETALVSAALYAGSTHRFTLESVILVAFAAAVTGDTMGYWIGRTLGLGLLTRYGKYIRLNERRLKVAEYLFWRHGSKIVFIARFVALLRVLAALFAGASRMPWPRFALMNALGGFCWALLFGGGAYVFGDRIRVAEGPIAIGLLVLVAIAILVGAFFYRRYESAIEARALEHCGAGEVSPSP